MVVLEGLLLC